MKEGEGTNQKTHLKDPWTTVWELTMEVEDGLSGGVDEVAKLGKL